MKSLKKLINDDLNKRLPELRNDIRNEYLDSIPLKQPSKQPFNFRLLTGAMTLITTMLILTLILFNLPKNNQSYTAIMLEINPKAVFTIGEDNLVDNVIALNEDAEVILTDTRINEFIDLESSKAINLFTDYAYQAGYIDSSSKAIRVSGVGLESSIENICNEVESYFCDKGLYVAVVENKVDLKGFNELIDMNYNTINDLKIALESMESSYIKRNNISGDELKVLYEEVVSDDDISSYCKNLLKNNITLLTSYKEKLDNINQLNEQIKKHQDNPSIFGFKLDYWVIKNKFNINEIDVSEEFKQLIKDMDELVSEVNDLYNVEIDSYEIFILTKTNVSNSLMIVEALDQNEIFNSILEVLDVLQSIGAETERLIDLFKIPTTEDEYLIRMDDYFNVRIENNIDNYSNSNKITETEYQNFIDEIIEIYGSLENFWKK